MKAFLKSMRSRVKDVVQRVKDTATELEFARDDSGQGFLEYVILASLVVFVAAAVYVLFVTIRNRFVDVNTRLEAIPY
jgi:Flp pilus assembly pilin Flp